MLGAIKLPSFIIKQVNLPGPPRCRLLASLSKILKQAPECTVGSAIKRGERNDIWRCLPRLQGRPLLPNRTGPPFSRQRSPTAGHPDDFPCTRGPEAFWLRVPYCARAAEPPTPGSACACCLPPPRVGEKSCLCFSTTPTSASLR